jgi:hypothetical protein
MPKKRKTSDLSFDDEADPTPRKNLTPTAPATPLVAPSPPPSPVLTAASSKMTPQRIPQSKKAAAVAAAAAVAIAVKTEAVAEPEKKK